MEQSTKNSVNEHRTIAFLVAAASRRRRIAAAWCGACKGLFFGAALWLVVLGLYLVLPLPMMALLWAGGLAIMCLVAGAAAAAWKGPTAVETALWIDQQKNLKERLTTALEMQDSTPNQAASPWATLVMRDAAAHAEKLNPRQLVPYKLPMAAQWCVLLLAMGAGLGYVTPYRSTAFAQKARDTEIIKQAGQRINELTRHSLTNRPPTRETTRGSLEKVAELGEHLSRASVTKNEALKDLSNMADKLKQDARELSKDANFKRLQEASRTPGGDSAAADAQLKKQIEDLQKALGDKPVSGEQLDTLKKELQKLSEAAAGMASNDPATAANQRQQLERALANLSQQAKSMGLDLPSLEDAMNALSQAQVDKFTQDMKAALKDIEKLKDMARTLEHLKQQAGDKSGRNLPEQLEYGQADAAKARMEKMAADLKKGALNPEELKALAGEVSRSIAPASDYGKVKDFLQAANAALKKGDKEEAGQQLAQAAKELEKLMEEAADAQAMLAALDALQRAQMSVANGQFWGQGGKGPPRFGRGGKAGRGVGTWADETGWMTYPEITERWDNTGIVRPDMDPRGVTDRGDGQLSDNLLSTKIKGQMTPGGQMPSMTLKGVSIKGVSKVQLQEAVVASQADAQAALNQDQVPRAYQGAVKGYFGENSPK